MNIFYLDKDLEKSSQYLCDSHIIKMPLEHNQMLSTAVRLYLGIHQRHFVVDHIFKTKTKDLFLVKDEVVYCEISPRELSDGSITYKPEKISKSLLKIANKHLNLSTHVNHPSSVWVRQSYHNFKWLVDYSTEMLKEYNYRYGNRITKNHLTLEKIKEFLPEMQKVMPDKGLTTLLLAMPKIYHQEDPILAYRDYYRNDKVKLLKYKNRQLPNWI